MDPNELRLVIEQVVERMLRPLEERLKKLQEAVEVLVSPPKKR